MTYTLISTKGSRTVEGTLEQAIAAAVAYEAELQPAYGVTIEDEAGETVAEIRDGVVQDAEDEQEDGELVKAWFREAGNGYPETGDRVIVSCPDGTQCVGVIEGSDGLIHTQQWQPNRVEYSVRLTDDEMPPESDDWHRVEWDLDV